MKHAAASYLDFVKKKPSDLHYSFHKATKSVVPSTVLKPSYIKYKHTPGAYQIPVQQPNSNVIASKPGSVTPKCGRNSPKIAQHCARTYQHGQRKT